MDLFVSTQLVKVTVLGNVAVKDAADTVTLADAWNAPLTAVTVYGLEAAPIVATGFAIVASDKSVAGDHVYLVLSGSPGTPVKLANKFTVSPRQYFALAAVD